MEQKSKRVYRKRIPYGMMNFEDVRKDDCYYVDKTQYIEEVEASNKYFFYIRPRRFGKSLTLSMLQNYYDVNKKDQFEKLFGGLYIGEYPTPERNSYPIQSLPSLPTAKRCSMSIALVIWKIKKNRYR